MKLRVGGRQNKGAIYVSQLSTEQKLEFIYSIRAHHSSILYTSIPTPGSKISAVEKLLSDLGDPFSTKGTFHYKFRRLTKLIQVKQIQTILIDGFKNVTEHDKEKMLNRLFEFFHMLHVYSQATIIFCRIHDFRFRWGQNLNMVKRTRFNIV